MKNEKLIKYICGIYFSTSEFWCKCNICKRTHQISFLNPQCNMKRIFLRKLMIFRFVYNESVFIRSGYRCRNHSDYSTNHDGYAADISYIEDNSIQRMKIVKSAINSGFNRIGISKNFIHIDCNPEYNGTLNEKVLWIYRDFYLK